MNQIEDTTQEAARSAAAEAEGRGKIISIDEGKIKEHLSGVVLEAVEETLNALLNAEADALCGAQRYERSAERVDTRAGSYERGLHTKAGEVKLKVPKLRSLPFETAIIERYKRRESSVEEALIERYLAGVSVRRVEDITEALWGTKVSASGSPVHLPPLVPSASSLVSDLNQKIYAQIEAWRKQPICGEYAYVYVDGMWLKRSWGGEVKNVSVLIAVGVNAEGYREVLAVAEGSKEDKASWEQFIRGMKERGLAGVKLFISDKCLGFVESVADFYPEARWQRCGSPISQPPLVPSASSVVHWYRNVWTAVPSGRVKEVAAMLKAIHAQEDLEAARVKAAAVVVKLRDMKLKAAAECVETGVEETLSYMSYPREHWRNLRTNNPLERVIREIRRRTRVVGAFPDGNSALMLVAARLRHIAGTKWGTKRYMDMNRLRARTGTEQEVAA